MHIERIYDEGLAHAAYVIDDEGQAMIVDPGRNANTFLHYLTQKELTLVGVIETHPHADFVSSHLELGRRTGAPVYVSKQVGALYPHRSFDTGDVLQLGHLELRAINTPGHSPDSISVVVRDQQGQDRAVFTGDTLFIGDVGRPDLRESAGNLRAKAEELARQMYHSTRELLMKLDPAIVIYPTHGAGSLCGKGISAAPSSTLAEQLRDNPALQPMAEEEFVEYIMAGQPYIPKYFGYNVELNKVGAPDYETAISGIPLISEQNLHLREDSLIIDARPENVYKVNHYPGSINIMDGDKFETWLGSIVGPTEFFYLTAQNTETLDSVVHKVTKIGYESRIRGVFHYTSTLGKAEIVRELNQEHFDHHRDAYTIVDVRGASEVAEQPIFEHSLNIPLSELRDRVDEIPADHPVVVHCASGYRSAVGSSILHHRLPEGTTVYDLNETVKDYL
jgi:glyoxylase-like metal-dependent hydrolase (beta-lactamase superfamily II)/rhodanese-related sulfurtransferase